MSLRVGLKTVFTFTPLILIKMLKIDLQITAACFELEMVKNEIIYMLKNLRKFAKDEKLPWNALTVLDSAFIRREPFGVCLIVGSWNYPFVVTMKPLIGAIAAGNCVVVKPSEISVESANVMAKLLPQYIDPVCQSRLIASQV